MSSRKFGWQKNVNDYTQVRTVSGVGAFGDLVTAPLTPVVQGEFAYGGHEDLFYEYTLLTGSIAYSDGMINLSTGATLYGTAYFRTNRVVRYKPGQGALFRFTAKFDTPVAGVSQTAGLYGGSENGIFVGYNYADSDQRFGLCLQRNGVREIRTLTVSVAASGAETFTVTLNGTATNVSLTSGTTAENAQEIADTAFSGWVVEANGSDVIFLADSVGARSDTYSVSSTGTADGTFAQNAAGAAVEENWYYQESWNGDKFDGDGPSGETLDPTKGNVFEIRMQYLGFGAIDLLIEDPETGRFQLAHRIKYANANTEPSISQPILALGAAVSNYTAASDVTVSVGSVAGFIEGKNVVLGPNHGVDTSGNLGATTAAPILSVRNNETFIDGVSKINLRDVFPAIVSASASGSNKPVVFRCYLNSTLTDPLWTRYNTDHSFASYDTSATARTGGDLIMATSFSSGNNVQLNLSQLLVDLRPGDTLTLELETTGNAADYTVSASWKEDA